MQEESKIKTISPQAGFQENFVRSNADVVIGGGVLNPMPLTCMVSTPDGFKEIGKLNVGDEISNPMGGTQKVNMIIDRGEQDCVEFVLQDGRRVQSALSHHWMVKERHGNILDISSEDIIRYIDNSKNKGGKHNDHYRIPMCEPVVFNDIYKSERKIHPYLLGVLLGDGCLSEKIYRADIGTKDIEIIERVRSFGYNVVKESKNPQSLHYCVRDKEVVEYLKELGLWGHLAGTKFIPDCYKYAPLEDRMELLKGLFDTDGHCSIAKDRPIGRVGYRTISKKLAEDVQEVIWSIGGKCVIHITDACIRKYADRDRNCSTSYGLLAWTKNDRELFSLERKRNNASSEDEKKVKTFLSIMDYKMLPKQKVRCINVSGDEHLYLTDGYVITRNCGKAQPLESKILTPQGWTTMGNLKVGDEISSTNGGTQRVLNIFERGMLDCLKFKFEDGTSVECCDEHLWTVWDKKNTQYKTIEAKEIVKNGIGRYSLPIIEPVNMTKKELPLDPYFLGVLIGDGCLGLYGTCITLTTDLEIIERVRKENDFDSVMVKNTKYPACRFNGKAIRDILRKLGLFGHHSHSKFIPKEYLYSSIEDRKRLLQGLLDTDGYNYTSSSRIEFCTTSEQLAKDVVILVKSLGGKVFLSTKIGSYKKDNVRHFCNKAWRLICRFDNPNDMFTIERKRSGIPSKGTFRTNIAKVERIGKKEMRCILVSDENHLYITDGMNPTHNSFAAILSIAAPSLDPNFRACFIRRTFTELKSGGGLTDDFTVAYGSYVQMKNSEPPRANFPSGSFVEFRQINDENIKKVTEGWKGSQYDLIYLDELTSYEFSTFKYLLSRNRGKAKWTGKFRGTTNPEKDCWVRAFIDWYIGPDGQIREDRNGVVRYFYIKGDSVDSVIWGNSKEEVYSQCKIDIDRKLKALGGDFTYENMIKSFTFYLGRMSENKASIGNNKDYAGSVASVGGKQARQLIEGNWNVSLRDNGDLPIPEGKAEQVFMNDPCMNNDKWITADLADSGTDNTVIFVWNGLHVMDYSILCKSTPRMNVERIQYMANKYDIPNEHIIYDAIRAPYVVDYIDDTMPFFSYHRTMGKYGLMYRFLKDECYARLCEVIKRDMLSFDDNVAQTIYEHQKLTTPITIKEEFIEECSVVQFKTMPGGKKALLNKKEMNSHLGKKRSMDVLDPCAMRMYPLLEFEYGQELTQTEVRVAEDSEGDGDCDIYDESTWS